MKKIGILITNPNHHWEMMSPVIDELKTEENYEPILISLSGLRRLADDPARYEQKGIEYRLGPNLSKLGLRNSSGQQTLGGGGSLKRRIIQRLAWSVWLRRRLTRLLRDLDGVLLLNDQAFPSDLITQQLVSRRIWVGLLQEGIRFPLPNEANTASYGCNNIHALFTWGESSAKYFRNKLGPATPTRVYSVGNPRYFELLQQDWSENAAALRTRIACRGEVLGLASNPIDDQGFCTPDSKLALLQAFLSTAGPLMRSREGEVWIKLHPRESKKQLQHVIWSLNLQDCVRVVEPDSIFTFLTAVDRVVVLASTVGLEALAMNRPLAVLPIEGYGHVHDYVKEGAAFALGMDQDLRPQLESFLAASFGDAERKYVESNLETGARPAKTMIGILKNAIPA
ncbi:capsular polysaccharide export protein, LipB/KpsS family [Roseimaritima sediminicola]|uniref:capsular polysaccharide export protein, LipB/KpsS family n=1 Tax=Roseimaritima sediminicola TaxID=2662066 RepID=UPI00138751CE|nr:hypothetical protein [Roseimaritima sediminicola]